MALRGGSRRVAETTLSFELATSGDETEVLFTHAGWSEPAAFMHHCSTKWGYFLIGLKMWLEGGVSVGVPERPEDQQLGLTDVRWHGQGHPPVGAS